VAGCESCAERRAKLKRLATGVIDMAATAKEKMQTKMKIRELQHKLDQEVMKKIDTTAKAADLKRDLKAQKDKLKTM
jgi:hypothetical protein